MGKGAASSGSARDEPAGNTVILFYRMSRPRTRGGGSAGRDAPG